MIKTLNDFWYTPGIRHSEQLPHVFQMLHCPTQYLYLHAYRPESGDTRNKPCCYLSMTHQCNGAEQGNRCRGALCSNIYRSKATALRNFRRMVEKDGWTFRNLDDNLSGG